MKIIVNPLFFQYIVEKTFDNDESQVREKINNFLMHAGIITHFLCYFNSAVNPIIYYFMSAQFKVCILQQYIDQGCIIQISYRRFTTFLPWYKAIQRGSTIIHEVSSYNS